MKLIEAKRPNSVIDVLAVVLIAPAILWILAVCWVFGGNREARKAYLWMFAERDSSNKIGQEVLF